MFKMLQDNNFMYDCTQPTRKFGYIDAEYGLYPYTLDYKSKQDCPIEPCPVCSWPGIWEQPMLDLEDEWMVGCGGECGNVCSMLDACTMQTYIVYVKVPQDNDFLLDLMNLLPKNVYSIC